MKNDIVHNSFRTPDGTILESKFRHDYRTYTDKNGSLYSIDGGLDYFRRSINGDEVDLSITLEDGHEKCREFATWGTYGKNGDQPLTYVPIKDLDLEHIKILIEYPSINPTLKIVMIDELKYRENNND